MSTLPDGRFIDGAPYDPNVDLSALDRTDMDASNFVLIWRKFKKHRLGLVSGIFLFLAYLAIPFAGFFSPYTPNERSAEYLYHPPQAIRLWHEGEFVGPFVYPTEAFADLENYRWRYTTDKTRPMPLQFFCKKTEYNLFGFIPAETHLFCAPEGATVFIFGSDRLGRDVFSRISYGAQLSLTVGLIGITVSFILGIGFGAIAGYFGGATDWVVNRAIEILRSLPELPLWRVIRRHLLPNFMSHLIASATLSIPAMILGETALSFLGLGLRAPAVSWGVMLNDAQNLASIEIYPWTAIPMLPIIIVVLAFNFLGDGLRDSLDPYT